MIVFRLTKGKYKNDLSGKGAEIAGGRWNSKGFALLYTSESRALCTTEIAVHSPLGVLPADYWIVAIEIPAKVKMLEIDPAGLRADWKSYPHPHTTQALGDDFIKKGEHLVMKVPSVVVMGDFNYLLNPAHALFQHVKIISQEPFEFDERFFIR